MISREELVKKFDDYVHYFKAYCTSDAEDHEMLKEVLAILKDQQNVISALRLSRDALFEAVEEQKQIVRCKDCMEYNECSIQFKFADADNPGEWFCAYGKRKQS